MEAVLAGAPILWSANRGIDGPPDGTGHRCDPTSPHDAIAGIRHLVTHEPSTSTIGMPARASAA
ncbi:MAG: hypothetical protein M5U07_19250 [Xanthobacteraceae bacterium]|nr:hypothetical protein [Xanthobacteraceae bacterium]